MDLWTSLQPISANYLPAGLAAGIGFMCAVVLGIVRHLKDDPTREALAGTLLIAAIAVGFAGLIGGAALAGSASADAREKRSDLIADYLLDEHDLLVLDPIHYSTACSSLFSDCFNDRTRANAWTSAVVSDGSVVEVEIRWLDFSSKPHDPDVPLPAAFDPITVTITTPVK